ncbi:Uncharacterised protein [uncultured Butyricicoccus sp.]|nr:Uncharacterised protein [uncultured Butyricicoccus sp.]
MDSQPKKSGFSPFNMWNRATDSAYTCPVFAVTSFPKSNSIASHRITAVLVKAFQHNVVDGLEQITFHIRHTTIAGKSLLPVYCYALIRHIQYGLVALGHRIFQQGDHVLTDCFGLDQCLHFHAEHTQIQRQKRSPKDP